MKLAIVIITALFALNSCDAKRKFKQKICDLAKKYNSKDINQKTCMSVDKALGSAVRNNGI